MAKYVFILGAGFSRAAGAPLMNEFLERAELLFRLPYNRGPDVFDAIAGLQRVHSKSDLDLYNLESVFGAFEMARVLGFPLADTLDPESLIHKLKELIAHTLERSIVFNKNPPDDRHAYRRMGHFDGYEALPALIRSLVENKRWADSAFIVLNYDLVLEYTLLAGQIGYDYCTPDSKDRGHSPLLKLHGSINWASCVKCRQIIPYHINAFLNTYGAHWGEGGQNLNLATALANAELRHCGELADTTPLLVPPSWNKLQYGKPIEPIWKAAAEELKAAENIFVIGYSLPETDLFFRHLYALGTMSDRLIKRFWVFDPDPNVEARWTRLLGPAARSRFVHFKTPCPECFKQLAAELKIDLK